MALEKMTAKGPARPLKKGEQLACANCGRRYGAEQAKKLWSSRRKAAVCAGCKKTGAFVRRRATSAAPQSVKKRWGEEVSKHGWTAVPAILIQNQGLLSLSATDLAVILQLEHHRRDPAKPVWPGVRTMAAQSGLSERTVRTRISTLEKRGLIEVRATRRSEGGTTSSRYTADGLRKVLALLAKNEAAKVEVDHGLEALLARLAAKGEGDHTARREADAKDAEVIPILRRRRAAKSA